METDVSTENLQCSSVIELKLTVKYIWSSADIQHTKMEVGRGTSIKDCFLKRGTPSGLKCKK